MPEKWWRSHADQARATQPTFRRLRRQHSGIESNQHQCLGTPWIESVSGKGWSGFQRYGGFGILAYNLHTIGDRLLAQDRKRQVRLKQVA